MSLFSQIALMSPGIGLIFIILSGYFFWQKKQKSAFSCLFTAFVLLWVLSTAAFGRFVTAGLISLVDGRSDVRLEQVDLIVVLTGGMHYAGEVGWIPTANSYRRMAAGLELQRRVNSRTPLLVSGGKTAGTRYPSEASVAARQFDKQQARIVPTLLEEVSINTYENALQSAHIIRDRGANHVVLVTSEEHMLRALAAFRGRGIDPIPFPVYSLERGPLKLSDFLPTAGGAMKTSKAFHEIYGVLHYLATERIRLEDVFYNNNNER